MSTGPETTTVNPTVTDTTQVPTEQTRTTELPPELKTLTTLFSQMFGGGDMARLFAGMPAPRTQGAPRVRINEEKNQVFRQKKDTRSEESDESDDDSDPDSERDSDDQEDTDDSEKDNTEDEEADEDSDYCCHSDTYTRAREWDVLLGLIDNQRKLCRSFLILLEQEYEN